MRRENEGVTHYWMREEWMMGRRALVAGNWKMHNTLAEARALMAGVREGLDREWDVEVVVCPPFTLLYPMGKEIQGTDIHVGAQNVYFEPHGAFTGEISAPMLKAAGCTYVIAGHSERRHVFNEGHALLAKKVRACLSAGLGVIYCVGETLEEREASRTMEVVEEQIVRVLGADVSIEGITVAYEPVWAIGTGRNATPEQAQEVHAFIRGKIGAMYGNEAGAGVRILYGGSVKPGNAAALLRCPDVDGALVGGACLVAEDFVGIIAAAGEWRMANGE